MSSVVPCSSKGRPGSVRVVKGGLYECGRCGLRWPMIQGSSHPE
ncbi:hypothetical protein OG252_13235 [Streptomyces sp. NBC_01352]|nr:hypothetical protein [Streptomyces sp. NBC_01352]